MNDRLVKIISNYEVKLRLGANGPATESEIQRRVASYGAAAAETDFVRGQVRQLLCGQGVPTIMFPYYYSFALELGKLKRREFTDDSTSKEMVITVSKWIARGLTLEVLRDIAWNVFNISWPEPPADA